ncbi:MAG: nicotinate-nucleotide adenylyltransferase [Actinomycetota bacterium]|nr:nicotinate-nucleotide adenylyltransferase [Actinomycetota bacterium]
MAHATGERLGVLGGTFDPVHVGHLVAAVNARAALDLDTVLLVVANQPWQKSGRVLTPAGDRMAMVEAAVAGVDGLEASRLELDRGGPTYTADTLEQLVAVDPDRELFLIVGADVAADLSTWERPDVVARLATLAVVGRGGVGDSADLRLSPMWRVEHVEIPRLEISSSDIRRRCAAGLPLDFLVPQPVITRIRALGLYAGGTMPTPSGGR